MVGEAARCGDATIVALMMIMMKPSSSSTFIKGQLWGLFGVQRIIVRGKKREAPMVLRDSYIHNINMSYATLQFDE